MNSTRGMTANYWPGKVVWAPGFLLPLTQAASKLWAHNRQEHAEGALTSGTAGYIIGLLVLVMVAGIIDTAGRSVETQWLLGAIAWLFLLISLWRGPTVFRLPVLALVLVATLCECLASLCWGAYEYRLHNLPMYVPPGHGLFYLAALRLSLLPVIRRAARSVVRAVLIAATCWSAHGLLSSPHGDTLGCLCWVLLLYFLLRGRDPLLFSLTFCLTMGLEFYGTAMGAWHWAAVLPGTGITASNPPSAIGAGYCVLDAISIRVTRFMERYLMPSAPIVAAHQAPPRLDLPHGPSLDLSPVQ